MLTIKIPSLYTTSGIEEKYIKSEKLREDSSTLLLSSIHCRVIFIIGIVFLVIAAAVLAAKVNIKNAWELAEK
ncbi:MAG: hypothetical protein ABIH66_08140 [bacterium]